MGRLAQVVKRLKGTGELFKGLAGAVILILHHALQHLAVLLQARNNRLLCGHLVVELKAPS